uniref:DNA-directed RNA polymerase sigma-70 factor n=1 Tax=Virgibacillus oceani TaxID=1479511 RepID=A0A917H901_9BACI|nr:DNA-directed RNA polymerase sigma-70 factor [Virgibacillus oceani]
MSGNKKSEITEWYHQFSDSIFKYICLMIHDYQQAEDLTHETFIKAYKYYNSFEHKSNPRTWLFSIAHNITIDFLRKKKPLRIIADILLTREDSNPLPADIVEIKENSKELYNAISNLKESYREVIIIRKIKGFSIKETTEILNWSEGKVKTTLYRAIQALEKQLIKEGFLNEKTI